MTQPHAPDHAAAPPAASAASTSHASADDSGTAPGASHSQAVQPSQAVIAPAPAGSAAVVANQLRPRPWRQWTGQDFIWWNTAGVLSAVYSGRMPNPVSPVIDPLRPTLGAGEVLLASCDAQMFIWRAGDATYNPSRGFFLAGGPVGLALTAAFFGGQAYLNSRRKKAAQVDAGERWRHLTSGRLTISTCGIYLSTGAGIMPIAFANIQEMQLTASGEIALVAANARGSARLKIRAQWAELILVLWAVQYLPQHPQLVGRTWLPRDWFMHAAAHGYLIDTKNWPQIKTYNINS